MILRWEPWASSPQTLHCRPQPHFPCSGCFPVPSERNTAEPLLSPARLYLQTMTSKSRPFEGLARGSGQDDVCLRVRDGCLMRWQKASPGTHLLQKSQVIILPSNGRCQHNQVLLQTCVPWDPTVILNGTSLYISLSASLPQFQHRGRDHRSRWAGLTITQEDLRNLYSGIGMRGARKTLHPKNWQPNTVFGILSLWIHFSA